MFPVTTREREHSLSVSSRVIPLANRAKSADSDGGVVDQAREQHDEGASSSNIAIVKRWVRSAGPFVLAAIAIYGYGVYLAGKGVMPRGTPAPLFSVQTASGEAFSLEEQRGKLVVLNFWATWCPPCRAEAPVLDRGHRGLGDGGVLIGLSLDTDPIEDVARHAERLGMSYPIALASRELARQYNVTTLPTTIVLNEEGEVVTSVVGELSDRQLAAAIAEADHAHHAH